MRHQSETFNPPDLAYAAERNITWDISIHGVDGPVQVSYAPYDYPGSGNIPQTTQLWKTLTVWIANFYNGAVSLGIQPAKDPNNGHARGLFRLLRSVDPKTQTRSSARVNRYDRDAPRPNYHILPSTAVARVLFNKTTATGVEYVNSANGTRSVARARNEVIIAAGGVHSPQILQLSGVGDASLLRKFGVKLVSDLPGVGQNLQDHLVLKVNYNCADSYVLNGLMTH